MRIATMTDGRQNRLALGHDERWYDVGDASTESAITVLLKGVDAARVFVTVERALSQDFAPVMPLLPSRNVMCLGKNFVAHAEEFALFNRDAEVVPSAPIIFTKAVAALCGPTDSLVVQEGLAHQLDYETELAVVIGKSGRNIGADSAGEYIAAYTVINDVTARDLQALHAQWFLGKSLPGASPMGPVLVTPDELDPLGDRLLSTWVNGELRQRAALSDMIVSVEQAIATISRVVPLQVGDVIAMGTPAGVAVSFDPPRFLQNGDHIVSEIEGIGRLENTVCIV